MILDVRKAILLRKHVAQVKSWEERRSWRTNTTKPAQIRYKLLPIVAIVLAVVVLASFSTFFGNTWLLLTGEGYAIPAESSIFTFNATIMNSGSGDWWLYGEDGKNYYQYTGQSSKQYIVYPKVRAINCRGFNPHNGATWCPLDTSERRN